MLQNRGDAKENEGGLGTPGQRLTRPAHERLDRDRSRGRGLKMPGSDERHDASVLRRVGVRMETRVPLRRRAEQRRAEERYRATERDEAPA